MLALLLLLPSLLALHLETPITQQSKLLILDEDSLHPWFAGGNQIFIDWEHTHARQLVISNPNPHRVNITVKASALNNTIIPFIQESLKQNQPESQKLRFTLLPDQRYKLTLEYNCTERVRFAEVLLELDEQTFKHSSSQRDHLTRFKLRLVKQCSKEKEPLFDWYTFSVIIAVYAMSVLCALINQILKNKQIVSNAYIEFTKGKQAILLFLIPVLSLLVRHELNRYHFNRASKLEFISFLIGFFCIWDFIKSMLPARQPLFSLLLAFGLSLIISFWHVRNQSDTFSLLVMFLCILQVSKRIVLKDQTDLYIFLAVIWIQEVYWLAHIHTVDKHVLHTSRQKPTLFFPTSISPTEPTHDVWNEKQIDIQMYQILALTLIQTFIFKNGLFNQHHINRIISVSVFQIVGLVIFDILYRNNLNPPFLTIVTGCMIFGIAANVLISRKGLEDPMIKFIQFSNEEQIKLKVSN